MIYISSVFPQLERKTTTERIHDYMLVLAKDGKWTGGNYPLGFTGIILEYTYKYRNSKTYLKVGSLSRPERLLLQNNIKNKKGTFYDSTLLLLILCYIKNTAITCSSK